MEAAAELRRLREQVAAQQAALAAAEAAAREAKAGRVAAEEALRDLRLVRQLSHDPKSSPFEYQSNE